MQRKAATVLPTPTRYRECSYRMVEWGCGNCCWGSAFGIKINFSIFKILKKMCTHIALHCISKTIRCALRMLSESIHLAILTVARLKRKGRSKRKGIYRPEIVLALVKLSYSVSPPRTRPLLFLSPLTSPIHHATSSSTASWEGPRARVLRPGPQSRPSG